MVCFVCQEPTIYLLLLLNAPFPLPLSPLSFPSLPLLPPSPLLFQVSPAGVHAIFERYRAILHEGEIDKRVQYMIESLFAARKAGFKEYPAKVPELDLVESADQITHELGLDDEYVRSERL